MSEGGVNGLGLGIRGAGGTARAGTTPGLGVRLLGNQAPTLLLLLSLNLLLIVFFVVLNANATADLERSRTVLGSLQRSFGAGEREGELRIRPAARVAAQDALRTSVSVAFSAILDGRDVVVRNQTDRFSVTTPLAAFYEPDSGALKPALPVLSRLVEILAAPPEDYRIEMTVTVNAATEDDPLAMAQAAALAAEMLGRDVDTTLFAVGTARAVRPGLTFTFDVLPGETAETGVAP